MGWEYDICFAKKQVLFFKHRIYKKLSIKYL